MTIKTIWHPIPCHNDYEVNLDGVVRFKTGELVERTDTGSYILKSSDGTYDMLHTVDDLIDGVQSRLALMEENRKSNLIFTEDELENLDFAVGCAESYWLERKIKAHNDPAYQWSEENCDLMLTDIYQIRKRLDEIIQLLTNSN